MTEKRSAKGQSPQPKSVEPKSAVRSSNYETATIVINGQAQEVDLAALSQRVYVLFQHELRIERERLGRR